MHDHGNGVKGFFHSSIHLRKKTSAAMLAAIGGADMHEQIKAKRLELGWSQFTLAVHAGVTPDTVGAVERGEGVTVRSLRAVALALGFDVALIDAAVESEQKAG